MKDKFAGVCVIKNNKILLVQESHEAARGLWSFPLGQVEDGEIFEDAAKREAKEETGYDVYLNEKKELKIKGKDFKSLHKFDSDEITLVIFKGEIKGGELKKGDDMLDAKWFDLNDLQKLSLRGEWLKFFL